MTTLDERNVVIKCIKDAINNGARKKLACEIIGLSSRTMQRWERNHGGDKRPDFERKSSRSLNDEEKNKIIEMCNSDEFKNMTPNHIVPILAERGIYLASESTYYRLLNQRDLLKHRHNSRPASYNKPVELTATGPNQVWSWDITYLKTFIKGKYYYLYLFMDVWSRMIVGFTVEECEDGDIASETISRICMEQRIESIYLHSDNGGPMKCGTMRATLESLGVIPSYSRPHVSNDNPFSESLFKTLKYRPSYPSKFKTLEDAKKWVVKFKKWYNEEHRHSGIKFVTPKQRHTGEDVAILLKRKETYIAAKMNRPDRWPKGIRNWDRIEVVHLNKTIEKIKVKKSA